jgi:hypothetical protein
LRRSTAPVVKQGLHDIGSQQVAGLQCDTHRAEKIQEIGTGIRRDGIQRVAFRAQAEVRIRQFQRGRAANPGQPRIGGPQIAPGDQTQVTGL